MSHTRGQSFRPLIPVMAVLGLDPAIGYPQPIANDAIPISNRPMKMTALILGSSPRTVTTGLDRCVRYVDSMGRMSHLKGWPDATRGCRGHMMAASAARAVAPDRRCVPRRRATRQCCDGWRAPEVHSGGWRHRRCTTYCAAAVAHSTATCAVSLSMHWVPTWAPSACTTIRLPRVRHRRLMQPPMRSARMWCSTRDVWRPSQPDGFRLLAHELAHVVQSGTGADLSGQIRIGETDAPEERQAEHAATRLSAAQPAGLDAGGAEPALRRQSPDDENKPPAPKPLMPLPGVDKFDVAPFLPFPGGSAPTPFDKPGTVTDPSGKGPSIEDLRGGYQDLFGKKPLNLGLNTNAQMPPCSALETTYSTKAAPRYWTFEQYRPVAETISQSIDQRSLAAGHARAVQIDDRCMPERTAARGAGDSQGSIAEGRLPGLHVAARPGNGLIRMMSFAAPVRAVQAQTAGPPAPARRTDTACARRQPVRTAPAVRHTGEA